MVLLKGRSCFPPSPYLIIPAPHHAVRRQSVPLSSSTTSPTKKMTHCLTGMPSDLIHWETLWFLVDKRKNVGMHSALRGSTVSNCETTLYSRINLSSIIRSCSNTETFPHWDSWRYAGFGWVLFTPINNSLARWVTEEYFCFQNEQKNLERGT